MPLSVLSASAVECEPGNEIWAHEKDGLTTVVYEPDPPSPSGRVVFEGWKGDQIQWRVVGTSACSNGVVVCGLSVPLSNGEEVHAPITEVYDGDKPAFMVFADLMQTTFRAQTYDPSLPEIVAEWFVPKPARDGDQWPVVLPSYYKLIGCQTGDELQGGR